ncbi:ATP-grasp domain-containing protein [Bacillus stercoris]|uniref:ATP-grasp domain-containing protein n=1 Tax=Bacillus stercoris TaxID=2054641 RepID=A0ABU0VAR8_9BACI|nr:ATP-grasp domain-containing protein [Bacillus stercoris]KFF55388.1 ATP-dependent carboxylate-amine ligase [Bacillus subtilis] [Bacillus stercoris]MDQ1854001.1 ATP-grasp domain-containing protein [Bacillus stercoris]
MDKVLIILGASEFGVTAARKLGFKVIVVIPKSTNISSKITEQVDYIVTVNSLEDADEIFEKIIGYENIGLVLSFTELGLKAACIISERLNLPTNSTKAIEYTRNKSLMRETFLKNDTLKLNYKAGVIEEFQQDDLPLKTPFIIKPLDGYGSKNISYIENQEEWTRWHLKNKSDYDTEWIAEPYIEGPEYSIETISSEGNHFIIGITEKDTTGKPNFIETGHSVPASLSQEVYKQIVQATKESLTLIGIKYGPSHIEVKWDSKKNHIIIIEMHTRPGGDYIPFLHLLSTGIDQYEIGIRSYFDPSVLEMVMPKKIKHSSIKFLTFRAGMLLSKGFVDKISNENIIDWDIYYNIGETVIKTTDSYSRGGHIIVSSNSKESNKELFSFFEKKLHIKII